jgi:putative heme-binding domain-containing protein
VTWPKTFASIAWRLHPPASVPALAARGRSAKLSTADRRQAVDALAFIDEAPAADAMLKLAPEKGAVGELATWWLLNRMSNTWTNHNLAAALKVTGVYNPEAIKLEEMVVPKAPANAPEPSLEEVLALTGDAARGKTAVARCQTCHTIGGVGAELGPALDGWGRGKSAEVIATAILKPSADIASGYDGTELRTTDGVTIQGLLIKQGDPLMMRSQGGVTQIIPANRAGQRRRMMESLMMSPAAMGLTARDVADLVAFLRAN